MEDNNKLDQIMRSGDFLYALQLYKIENGKFKSHTPSVQKIPLVLSAFANLAQYDGQKILIEAMIEIAPSEEEKNRIKELIPVLDAHIEEYYNELMKLIS